jgi:glucose-6-phosphate 1-dehydrogenase
MKIVIFGASGDLAKRKLFPALSRLDLEDVEIIGYARSSFDVPFGEIISEFCRYSGDFLKRVRYIRGNYSDLSGLRDIADESTVFYLAVPPVVYKELLLEISKLKYRAVGIEKPYGSDKRSFEELKILPLDKMVFIDHFLLKPMAVAAPELIGARPELRRLLNRDFIKNVEIVFKEAIGGEGRSYFDTTGLMKDVVQNHLAELMAVAAAESSGGSHLLQAAARSEVFNCCTVDVGHCIFGQYESYRKELHRESSTETLCVVPVYIDVPRWSKVPFILFAGKGMNEKKTEVVYEFRREAYGEVVELIPPSNMSRLVHIDDVDEIKLLMNVTPRSEIYLRVRMKEDVFEHVVCDKECVDAVMRSHYGSHKDYELIFHRFIKDLHFARVGFNEAAMLWRVFTPVLEAEKELFYYSKGIDIPNEVEELVGEIKKER